jgi:uncharacterized membrane protein
MMDEERLVFFSDAVVAIAITLLALELPVPTGRTNADFLHSLGDHGYEYLAFLISFFAIYANWSGHHRLFGQVTRLAGRLAQWNMLWLLTIVAMPFATRVVTSDGAFSMRFVLYAVVQALAGLFFLLMLREIHRHRLLRPDAPPRLLQASVRGVSVVTGGFLVSIPLAFVTHLAYLCWIVVPLGSRLIRRLVTVRRTPVQPAG